MMNQGSIHSGPASREDRPSGRFTPPTSRSEGRPQGRQPLLQRVAGHVLGSIVRPDLVGASGCRCSRGSRRRRRTSSPHGGRRSGRAAPGRDRSPAVLSTGPDTGRRRRRHPRGVMTGKRRTPSAGALSRNRDECSGPGTPGHSGCARALDQARLCSSGRPPRAGSPGRRSAGSAALEDGAPGHRTTELALADRGHDLGEAAAFPAGEMRRDVRHQGAAPVVHRRAVEEQDRSSRCGSAAVDVAWRTSTSPAPRSAGTEELRCAGSDRRHPGRRPAQASSIWVPRSLQRSRSVVNGCGMSRRSNAARARERGPSSESSGRASGVGLGVGGMRQRGDVSPTSATETHRRPRTGSAGRNRRRSRSCGPWPAPSSTPPCRHHPARRPGPAARFRTAVDRRRSALRDRQTRRTRASRSDRTGCAQDYEGRAEGPGQSGRLDSAWSAGMATVRAW